MAPAATEDGKARVASQEAASEVSRDNAADSTSEHKEDEDSNSNHGSEDGEASESEAVSTNKSSTEHDAPPLPSEDIPPLPSEAPPGTEEQDDGWQPVWDANAQAFYFYNRFSGASQWDNPRVPSATPAAAPGVEPPSLAPPTAAAAAAAPPATSGYNPAIHGDYDPNAWYAQPSVPETQDPSSQAPGQDPAAQYAATAAFNRFTGRFQNADITPENFNDENKSRRQMNAFFDVDAAANSHDGRSLKAERSGKKLSKTELKQFKEKRKMKKEEKRRAWLRD